MISKVGSHINVWIIWENVADHNCCLRDISGIPGRWNHFGDRWEIELFDSCRVSLTIYTTSLLLKNAISDDSWLIDAIQSSKDKFGLMGNRFRARVYRGVLTKTLWLKYNYVKSSRTQKFSGLFRHYSKQEKPPWLIEVRKSGPVPKPLFQFQRCHGKAI